MRFLISFIAVLFLMAGLNGCCPTYPKEKFTDSIIRICKNEYKADVKAETVGKTIAIYLPLENLLDFTFAITKSASEKINDVILSVSRVALSSDAKFDFYCVIAHDVRIPEIQIVIIKSVDDVKRFLLNDISRDEYSKRMLIDIRLSPQAQKERSIKEVFEKMTLDKKWQDQVMNDFFRSEPTVLGDIGYWGGRFYIKDISKQEFLSEQIASRVRMDFREDKKLFENFLVKSVKGTYVAKEGKKYFRIEGLIDPRSFRTIDREAVAESLFASTVNIAAKVLRGYRFEDYEFLEVINQADSKVLRVTKDDLEAYRKKNINFEDVLVRNTAL